MGDADSLNSIEKVNAMMQQKKKNWLWWCSGCFIHAVNLTATTIILRRYLIEWLIVLRGAFFSIRKIVFATRMHLSTVCKNVTEFVREYWRKFLSVCSLLSPSVLYNNYIDEGFVSPRLWFAHIKLWQVSTRCSSEAHNSDGRKWCTNKINIPKNYYRQPRHLACFLPFHLDTDTTAIQYIPRPTQRMRMRKPSNNLWTYGVHPICTYVIRIYMIMRPYA